MQLIQKKHQLKAETISKAIVKIVRLDFLKGKAMNETDNNSQAKKPKIFRANKRLHWEKPPFIYAKCPDRYKPILKYIMLLFGMLGLMVFFCGGFIFIVYGPIWLMLNEPEAPISKALSWCSQLFDGRFFSWIYLFVSILVFWILLYCFIRVDYFTYSQWLEDSKPVNTPEELERKGKQKQ